MASGSAVDAQQLERSLLRRGVVALAKLDASVAEAELLKQTGVVVVVADAAIADIELTDGNLEEVAEQILSTVRL